MRNDEYLKTSQQSPPPQDPWLMKTIKEGKLIAFELVSLVLFLAVLIQVSVAKIVHIIDFIKKLSE